MIDYSKIIENEIELSLYTKKVQEIEKFLNTYGEQDFWSIVSIVGGSERRILRLLDEMEKNQIIKFNDKTKKFYKKNEVKKHEMYLCKHCNGSTIELGDLIKIKPLLGDIWNNKPKPTLLFDQRPVTLETSLKRVAYLMNRNDVHNKSIVFLGDDDLTSICLAFAYKECDITVFDADERLIDYINKIAIDNNLNVKAIVLNVMNDIPKQFIGKFDVLMTDPTPEKVPFTVFMNTAIELLKPDGILYTSIYSSAMEKNMDLQRIITEMNLYITEMIPNFTHYKNIFELYRENDIKLFDKYGVKFNDESICFTETLFRMNKTEDTIKKAIEYTLGEMIGKATKRVMNDSSKEVAEKSNYLKEVEKQMKNDINKTVKG